MPKIRNLYLVAIFLIGLFLLTRLYKIDSSFTFFNDMGRDFLELWQWQNTGKPPLLGPQTSALPFNQSAIYFYLLYPFYLLSGQSYYTSLIAYLVFYIFSFVAGLYFLRNYPRLEKSLLLVFLLTIVHPQYILQGRFVWNPSFVTPCIVAAFYSLAVYLVQKKPQRILLMFSAFALALATAFSYSVVPAVLGFFILIFYRKRQVALSYYFYTACSLLLVNLPTVFFELRHGFLLSKMMFAGDRFIQSENSLLARLTDLINFTLDTNWSWALLFLLFIIGFFYLSNRREKNSFLENSFILFALTLVITLLSPLAIHSHYVFAILPLLFLIIGFLRIRYIYMIAIFLYVIFIRTALKLDYFAPAHNSLTTLTTCTKDFCQNNREALYVSNQSKYHPYHNAMEWQYLLAKAGCEVKDINTENGQASQMLVVLDDSEYSHGETAFYELTLFGESEEKDRSKCSESLEFVTLEK